MLRAFVDGIDGLGLSQAIQNTAWAIPTLQAVHILAIAVAVSTITILNLRLAGFVSADGPLRAAADRAYVWIWSALAVLAATGVLLVMGEPERALLNRTFQIKMVVLLLAIASTASLRWIAPDQEAADVAGARRRLLQAAAALSLSLWVALVVAGRWIAYTGV